METGWLELLKSMSIFQIAVISTITILALRRLRATQKGDVREEVRGQLGLKDDETFDDKLNGAIAAAFQGAVHPITEALRDLSGKVGGLTVEVGGLRKATNDHGERLSLLEIEVVTLTVQVGGPEAAQALRDRIERRRALSKRED